jgi:nucleotide-binding universal stress UspA family protein
MKRILVPTDFSTSSQASYKFALDMASLTNGEVFVVHMMEIPILPETTFGIQPHPLDPKRIIELEERATKAFQRMSKQYSSTVPVNFTSIHDYIVPGIRLFIEQNKIDVVVMSTHGASGLGEFFIGSKAEKIARFSPVPVIAIPKEVSFSSIKNIVFPNTLKLDQKDLMEKIKVLQSACNATLHVLLISTPLNFNTDTESKDLLERFAEHYALQNYTLNHRNHQHERSGIIGFLNEVKGDMIAMSTHGRKGLAHFIKGSIAESVLNHINHPIWTYNINK